MTTAASGDTNARPPAKHADYAPEAAVRRTARVRPLLPVATHPARDGFNPDDPYVRRYWVAAIGPSAVAELLRLVQAGRDGACVPLPRWLPVLIRNNLVEVRRGTLVVVNLIPPVPPPLTRRFPPGLREQHRRVLAAARNRPGTPNPLSNGL